MYKIGIILLLVMNGFIKPEALALSPLTLPEQVDAFKGAEGFGRYTVGGRGGRVLRVTNLHDAGKGSFRAAVVAKGPRIVEFDVSGIIELKEPLIITNDNITINGQTAPGSGITLKNYGLSITASEVVVRYIRARPGDEMGEAFDAISVSKGRNIIIDHCSVSWATDETLSVSQSRKYTSRVLDNVTVQWSIISESLNKSVHPKGKHGYGSLIRGSHGSRYSFHHNLWAHHIARMPRPGNYISVADDPVGPLMDFRNNVFYNWGGSHSGYNGDTHSRSRYNFINNYYLTGVNSRKPIAFEESSPYAQGYFSGNVMNGVLPKSQLDILEQKGSGASSVKVAHKVADVRTVSASKAFAEVLCNAGASKHRDWIDNRVIRGVRAGTGRLINSPKDVGGWHQPSGDLGQLQLGCD